MTENMLSINEILSRLKKHVVLIVIMTLIVPLVVGVYYTKMDVPKYQSSSKLFIGKKMSDKDSYYNSGDVAMYQNLMATYVELIKTEDLVRRAIGKISIENREAISPNYVISGLNISLKENTQILEVNYKDYTPELSKKVLDSIVDEFIDTSEVLIPNVKIDVVVESKFAKYPIKSKRNIFIAASLFIGFMIGAIIALFIEAINSKITSEDEIEKIIGVSVIGLVPEYSDKIYAKENKKGGILRRCFMSKKKKKAAILNP